MLAQALEGIGLGGRRGAATVFVAQYAEDVVGAEWLVAGPDQLQHTLAQGSQAQTLARTDGFGFGQRMADAAGVIVGACSQGGIDHGQGRSE